ncbi:type III-A CRISPR-associated RAMP protein Csm5 [Anaerostipes sp. 992a]|uniref:type III-A CRISPR-associated RAMP protein Csm5 n=1 Tax=Anaerostipes sp. 992a TaxID=1261637 RepID=UPI000951CC24|nr:type III-A CRISPR-associated RAMP protein Csm5 [Anaerostipes sp. 992a]OLR64024.1 type III-A CRISPR-associated RAMP protein Csm5 [Anaerostipes sp. 992a]
MVKDYLKHYRITLKTHGPLFIGSGEVLGKKEYIYDRANKKAYILDTKKMFSGMLKNRMVYEYEKYLLNEYRDLGIWLREHGIRKQEYQQWSNYVLDCSATEIESRENRNKEIHLFMKDQYGKPYIPGSSLKGAIRTILLGNAVIGNAAYSDNAESIVRNSQRRVKQNKYLQREIKNLEVDVFHTIKRKEKYVKSNAVNDELSGLRISDSKPLETDCLVLCQKIDRHIEGKDRNMPLLRECIKPGVEITFELTIDTSVCNYSEQDILNAISRVYERNSAFYKKFGNINDSGNHMLYLGGGCGFVTKTIQYCLYPEKRAVQINANIMTKLTPRNHGHGKDIKYRVSPHVKKLTRYSGREYEFGLCEMNISKM